MTKMIHCSDMGNDCDFTAHAQTEDEVLQQIAVHAKEVHAIEDMTPELVETAKHLIHSH
jgi:predicted small metal-binding protein